MIEEVEKKIRRRWLIFYIFNTALNIGIFALTAVKNRGVLSTNSHFTHPQAVFWLSNLLGLGVLLFVAWLFFYFPYVKKGTKLLTFQLFMTPILLTWAAWKAFQGGDLKWYEVAFTSIQSCLFFYFTTCLLMANRAYKLRTS